MIEIMSDAPDQISFHKQVTDEKGIQKIKSKIFRINSSDDQNMFDMRTFE